MQGKYITSDAWEKMFAFLKEDAKIYVVSEERLRNFVEAVYWIMRTGAQWRELPERYGAWNSVYKRFDAWSKKGVWEKLFAFCIHDPDQEYLSVDATIVRAHPCAAGHGKQAEEGLGRSKGGFATKVHAKVDALGNPLKFIITPGQVADITQGEELIKGDSESHIIGDMGYDSDPFRRQIRAQNCCPVIPGKSNRTQVVEYDKHVYKERSVIECFFSKIKQYRLIFSRFDKKLRNYRAFLLFVGTCIWLR